MPSPGAVRILVLAFQVALTRLASAQSTIATTSTVVAAATTSTSTTASASSPTPSSMSPSTPGPTLALPCCFASAQNATSLGPVVVLRRDDEKPSLPGAAAAMLAGAPPGAGSDPTWEATLRRAATRALTWEGLAEAPFVAAYHSAEVLAALDEPGDIRVLARGLLVADRDARPVFREVDLPGERCVHCPADEPGPNGESIKAMWSVRRIRHSGPNADHRPCYELQFSVTPIVASLPTLNRWEPGAAGWSSSKGLRAGLRAESRVSRQRELRPKGLILRVNPQGLVGVPDDVLRTPLAVAYVGDTLPLQQLAADALGEDAAAKPRRPAAVQRTDPAARTTATTLAASAATPAVTTTSARVHEHLHHHFYMRGGVPVYAGSTTEMQFPAAPPTPPFRASPQYHEYSQPDPLFHPPPGMALARPDPGVRATASAAPAAPPGHGGQAVVGHGGHAVAGQVVHVGHAAVTTGSSAHAAHATPTAPTAAGHYPNSINEQLPPAGDDADTRVPYVSASKQTLVRPTPRPGQGAATTLRFPPAEAEADAAGPGVTILPSTHMYRVAGGYAMTTPNAVDGGGGGDARPTKPARSAKPTLRTKVAPHNYYEIGRPTKAVATAYPDEDVADSTEPAAPTVTATRPSSTRATTMAASTAAAGKTGRPSPANEYLTEYPVGKTGRPTPASEYLTEYPIGKTGRPTPASEYLSEYPAATVRGTTSRPTPSSRVPLFTPHYGKDFEMSILKVMTSKVPSYIDVFTEDGVRVTTEPPGTEADDMMGLSQTPTRYGTRQGQGKPGKPGKPRLFTENPHQNPYSLVPNGSEAETTTPRASTAHKAGRNPLAESTTPPSPLQITFFVATEDDTRQPSASTLVSDPYKQDDTTTYQYTILRSVEQSIKVMQDENDKRREELEDLEEPISSTRRVFTIRDDPKTNGLQEPSPKHEGEILPSTPNSLSIVNGHTNHINFKAKPVTESTSEIVKNISLITDPPTTRKPWRPSTRSRRPWRQRNSYKDFYKQRRGLNHTTTASSVEPTSIVESRKTYSVSASRKRKPLSGQQRKSYLKHHKPNKRREPIDYQSEAESLYASADSDVRAVHRVSTAARFLRTNVEH